MKRAIRLWRLRYQIRATALEIEELMRHKARLAIHTDAMLRKAQSLRAELALTEHGFNPVRMMKGKA